MASFGRKTARNVRNKLICAAELLCANPYLGSVEPLLQGCTQLEYRTLVADTYTKIVYTVHNSYIYIHLLWDVRQNHMRMSEMVGSRYTFFEQHNHIVNEPPIVYGSENKQS